MGSSLKSLALVLLLALAGCADAPEPPEAPPATTSVAPSVLNFAFDAIEPTISDATLQLVGNVSAPAVVLATVTRNKTTTAQVDANGPWNLTVDVPFGRSVLRLSADDGSTLIEHQFQLIRLAPLTFSVDYGAASTKASTSDAMWIDIDALASSSLYEAEGASHPGFPNIHDTMVTWEQAFGHTIEYSYSTSFQSFGVNRIDGEGNPLTASAPPWWCYAVNGEAAELGITLQPYAPGDIIAWNLGSCT